MIAGAPHLPEPVPDAVGRLAGDDSRPVWHNQAGSTIFEVDGG